MTTFSAWIGLGANLGNAQQTLKLAVHALTALPHHQIFALSGLYQSVAIGPEGQPDYFNAVAGLRTPLTPHELLHALHHIENTFGRERKERWGARTLDLDILLYENDVINTPDLTIPHRELENRNFVIIPLLDAWPDAHLTNGSVLRSLPLAHQHEGLTLLHAGKHWGN